MVVSAIDPTLNYAEIRTVNLNDTKMESELYQIMILGINVIIAVGSSKQTNKNITYFPIYLVKTDNMVVQIGLYEFLTTALSKYVNQLTNNLLVSNKMVPLLYSFTTPNFLHQLRKPPEIAIIPDTPVPIIPKRNSQVKIPEIHTDIFLSGAISHRPLMEESKADAIDMRQKYHKSDKDTWVNSFMQNKHYVVDELEGNDKCFFTAIKDAFSSIGFQTSVDKLRHKLSINISADIFDKYKQFYDALNELNIKSKTYISQLQARNTELKQLIVKTFDRTTQINIIQEGENNLKLFNKLKNEKKMIDQYLHEYRFMKGVLKLADFQKKIRTCAFWAETWAIAEVERILNVKFVIMLQSEYLQSDINNVIQCGYKHVGLFQPDYYILMTRMKADYTLISYKGRKILTYLEVPYDVKRMVSDKCIEYEENTGFSTIPEFMKSTNNINEELIFADGLYDDDIVFVIYERSTNNLPGHGNGEQIPDSLISEYAELSSDAKWRNKLSNEWIQPFELDGHKWSSAEHYYQGSKFKKENANFYRQFSIDSGMQLANNVEMSKSAGRKLGTHKGIHYRERDVMRDNGFQRENAMQTALVAKFTQHPDLKEVLLNTLNAKIMIHRKGMQSTPATALMTVRKHLSKKEIIN
jgi:predicted NAD-dependent protein-ADP-ribosyltransferase YbiA (DUF1768 family)